MQTVGFEPTRILNAEDLKSSPLTSRANLQLDRNV